MRYLFVFFLLCNYSLYSQDRIIEKIPIDNGKIIYEEIDTVPGKSKDVLFVLLKTWSARFFTDSKEVIQAEDKEAGLLSGRGIMYINSVGLAKAQWPCWFIFQINIKDDRYRIQLKDFYYSERKEPIETLYNDYNRAGKGIKKSIDHMFEDLNNYCLLLIDDVKRKIREDQDNF